MDYATCKNNEWFSHWCRSPTLHPALLKNKNKRTGSELHVPDQDLYTVKWMDGQMDGWIDRWMNE